MTQDLKCLKRLRSDQLVIGEIREPAVLERLKEWKPGKMGAIPTVMADDQVRCRNGGLLKQLSKSKLEIQEG